MIFQCGMLALLVAVGGFILGVGVVALRYYLGEKKEKEEDEWYDEPPP